MTFCIARSFFLFSVGLGEAAKREVGTAANQLPDMSSFKSSMSGNGYMCFPGGLILQWGMVPIYYSSEHSSYAVPGGYVNKYKGSGELPIAFPNSIMCITATSNDTPNVYLATIYPASKSGFNWSYQSTQAYNAGGSGANSFSWIAFGY